MSEEVDSRGIARGASAIVRVGSVNRCGGKEVTSEGRKLRMVVRVAD